MRSYSRCCLALGATLTLSVAAAAQTVLFDTGTHEACTFNGVLTNLGWNSGNLSPTMTERWAAQPFTLPPGSWHVTQLAPEIFVPAADPTDIAWKIWRRNGQLAPTPSDEVASGMVTYAGDPNAPLPVSLIIPGGDYYLTVYGVGNSIAWFTNAPNGINFLDGAGVAFMWRSAMYPTPGFAVYQLPPATLSPAPGGDPNDLYNAGFQVRGDPAPIDLDIKPGSCPNPVNVKSQGVLPVAIAAAMGFDVQDIDPMTLQLRRADGFGSFATPTRWGLRDVATPWGDTLCSCAPYGPDGILDLGLHFKTQDVVTLLDLYSVPSMTEIQLDLTGYLYDGTYFVASDCIRVQGN